LKKFVTINVGGKDYKIRFGMNNIIQLEEKLGKGIGEIKGGTLQEIRAMIYCTVSPNFENEEQAGEWMDDALDEMSMEDLIKKLIEAMELGMGKQKPVKKSQKK